MQCSTNDSFAHTLLRVKNKSFIKFQDAAAQDLDRKIDNDPRFLECKRFLGDCHQNAIWRLNRGEQPVLASFYIAEIMTELSRMVADLVAAGDLMIARRLLPVVDDYNRALKVYGPFVCPDGFQCQGIEQILRKHKARKLLEMISALHPKWDTDLNIKNRKEIETFSEGQLRKFLLTKVKFIRERSEYRRKRWKNTASSEWRTHPLAELIENAIELRVAEAARINLFVQFLRQGWLWSLGSEKDKHEVPVPGTGSTFKKCPWHGRKKMPPVGEWQAWISLMRPYLHEITGGDPRRLSVFRYFLVARKGVYATKDAGRLVDDKSEYIWNQVENRICKTWMQMAQRERKRFLKKIG